MFGSTYTHTHTHTHTHIYIAIYHMYTNTDHFTPFRAERVGNNAVLEFNPFTIVYLNSTDFAEVHSNHITNHVVVLVFFCKFWKPSKYMNVIML